MWGGGGGGGGGGDGTGAIPRRQAGFYPVFFYYSLKKGGHAPSGPPCSAVPGYTLFAIGCLNDQFVFDSSVVFRRFCSHLKASAVKPLLASFVLQPNPFLFDLHMQWTFI